MLTQTEKALAFRALHQRDRAFLIPNPWDIGSAKLLAHMGFEALASTSMGYALSIGMRDNTIGRDRLLKHLSELAAATDLPVSADLENGFGDAPEIVAETIRLAAATGIVGGSIEDSTGRPDAPIYSLEHATERIRAAVSAVKALPFSFTLTARAENYLHGRPDLKDTIARLQAFQEAGADVLYAPGLVNKDDIASVVKSVDRPVNILIGLPGLHLALADLSALGVRRVSVGSGLYRAAMDAFVRAAEEMRAHGTITFADGAKTGRELSAAM